jgi:hypothetical protein
MKPKIQITPTRRSSANPIVMPSRRDAPNMWLAPRGCKLDQRTSFFS